MTTDAPASPPPQGDGSEPQDGTAPAGASELDVALSFIKDGFRRAGQRRYGRRPFQLRARPDGAGRPPQW